MTYWPCGVYRFFGGAFNFGFGGSQEEETPRGDNVHVELEVSLKDIYTGRTFTVKRDKNVIKPASGKRECNCKQKVYTKPLGPGMFQQITRKECEQCDNVKFVREIDNLDVTVEPGMVDRQEISFFEEGEPVIDGDAGDLIFVLRVLPDPVFKRLKNDLKLEMTISLLDALVGFKRELKHLDGHMVTVENKGITSPGQVMKIAKEGMPVYETGKKGDLYITFIISFPTSLSDGEKKQVQSLFGTSTWQHEEL